MIQKNNKNMQIYTIDNCTITNSYDASVNNNYNYEEYYNFQNYSLESYNFLIYDTYLYYEKTETSEKYRTNNHVGKFVDEIVDLLM
jgi:hypothetical protein